MSMPRLGASAVLALAVGLAGAQSAHRSDDVLGMSGMASVSQTRNPGYATVVFNSNTPLSAASSQMVFVLQAEKEIHTPSLIGRVRVFTGDGFIAIEPEDGAGEKLLFKFADRDVPPRLAHRDFRVLNIVGIARYGEHGALTSRQVSCLVATGTNCGPA